MIEHFFQCPHCWEEISFILDSSVSTINYIEDCEVCCNPIEIEGVFKNNDLETFMVRSIEQ